VSSSSPLALPFTINDTFDIEGASPIAAAVLLEGACALATDGTAVVATEAAAPTNT
jgi:hypothetical protein